MDTLIDIQFYDVDSMEIVWHGNYMKYLEKARCNLFNEIGYSYAAMKESGYAWPVVKASIKYIKPCTFMQRIRVRAKLTEYEHRIVIKYVIMDEITGELLSKAETAQMAVNLSTMQSCFESPEILKDKVEAYINA